MHWTNDPEGRIAEAEWIPSPNHDLRPQGMEVRILVIHAISLPPDRFGGPGIIQLFTNHLSPDEHPYYRDIAALRVSAHFLIRRDGSLLQFVPANRRAWHAGISEWQGLDRCNDFSIGIELEGCDAISFESEQYETLVPLLKVLRARYSIEAIVGHAEIAPGRKTDPGPYFDWSRIA
ncbi:MAG: 1,6-anhydro-N-acetylmuramyl-L-alanine amidase AmpD [Proteobacteria bacterium]|nr:1,6-anhydro-N-acetylmuramyl-L-alanine amidase AmpD [Pseudomonadota bacterium]HQR02844.1 1,6-anhydro-N-acetylmuramyl-L-alanine amidase AmpD [Rhodocyclaceae bacterium]